MWELEYKESWAPKNWCFWTVVLEKTLESPLDSREIQPVHPKRNQSWIFIGRTDAKAETPILWPPDVKNWLIKDPDARKDWGWEEKGTSEDEMVGWHHWLNGHEFEQVLGVGAGRGGLACCSPWGRKELDSTEWLNNNKPKLRATVGFFFCSGLHSQERNWCWNTESLCIATKTQSSQKKRKTDAETGAAEALCNSQRMEKQELSLQINFSTQCGWKHHLYRRVEVKGSVLEREGGIFMTYPRTQVWFESGTGATLLFSLCLDFSGYCYDNCQLSWCWWVCHLACYYSECIMKIKAYWKSNLLSLVVTNPCFSFCRLLLKFR